jgi:hypothetical protein
MTVKQGFTDSPDGDSNYTQATTTDLSSLCPNPFENQSQSACNTITEPPPFGAPGLPSEATADTGSYTAEHPVTDVFGGPKADGNIKNTKVS